MQFDGSSTELWLVQGSSGIAHGDGSSDLSFSVLWVGSMSSTGGTVVAKYDEAGDKREWRMFFSGSTGSLFVNLHDQSSSGFIGRASSELVSDKNQFHCYGFTYDASSTSTGIKIYRNGTDVSARSSSHGGNAYSAMEALGAKITSYQIGAAVIEEEFQGKTISFTLFDSELTANQMRRESRKLLGFADRFDTT